VGIIEFKPPKYLFTLNRCPSKTHGRDGLPQPNCPASVQLTAPPAFLIFWLLMVILVGVVEEAESPACLFEEW